ncbi:MAG: LCP family protein [Actinomycetota bacterium]
MVGSLAVAAGSAYGYYLFKRADAGLKHAPPGQASKEPQFIPPCATSACTYLVIGNDSRKGLPKSQQNVAGHRSDTIMLVRIDAKQGKTIVLSFPRDLWVHIPNQGWGKITSAYQGGPIRVAEVVTHLTGIEINHFVSVDLAGFQSVVDAIGTIPICISAPLVDPTHFSGLDLPHAGCYDLNGGQALAFVRARHICGEGGIPDFNRISRQQQFLRAVLAKVLSPAMVFRAPGLIRKVAGSLLVDHRLNLADLIYLSRQLSGVGTSAVDFRTVPGNPYATVETSIGTQDVVTLLPQAKELFRRLREGKPLGKLGLSTTQTPPSTAVIPVQVVDDSSNGAATQVNDYLQRSGFEVQPVTTTNSFGMAGPVILFAPSPAGKQAADVVHGYLKQIPEHKAPPGTLSGLEVGVVIPSTYEGVPISSPQPSSSPAPGGSGCSA